MLYKRRRRRLGMVLKGVRSGKTLVLGGMHVMCWGIHEVHGLVVWCRDYPPEKGGGR